MLGILCESATWNDFYLFFSLVSRWTFDLVFHVVIFNYILVYCMSVHGVAYIALYKTFDLCWAKSRLLVRNHLRVDGVRAKQSSLEVSVTPTTG